MKDINRLTVNFAPLVVSLALVTARAFTGDYDAQHDLATDLAFSVLAFDVYVLLTLYYGGKAVQDGAEVFDGLVWAIAGFAHLVALMGVAQLQARSPESWQVGLGIALGCYILSGAMILVEHFFPLDAPQTIQATRRDKSGIGKP